ncbi:uncharacterized protein LOC111831441 [Capsella rubella]|uniref:uncharacterized protein LOC111831441 n=1 Tax=Capsella rubella TaxID=81985 RepID=UPI000CD4A627|nr:uncharacterized protein LOC111831441 [Capsella rubella]
MSSAMDKALLAMSLEEVEEDLPFEMPDLPQFLSMERNVISLIGRTLNPACQSMKNLIRDMPRKWQKPGRMRGVALSKEKFQFIFNSEHDLQEILDKGSHTYNEWSLAVDRWYENPPANYLQFIPLWVQIWNLPINYYTVNAITALGELIGEVKEVAFDPNEPQIQEFVRVKVLFDVSRPLRRSKMVNLPKGGGSTMIRFQYEKVQKRCYECQRLTHEKDFCPILIKQRQDTATARRAGISTPKPAKVPFLKEDDPLFGILAEDQVGIDPMTGRHRIAADVLEGMRQYLLVNNNEDWYVKAERVKKSVREVEKDPVAKKSILRLESPLIVHQNVNKDKGIVFGYDISISSTEEDEEQLRKNSVKVNSETNMLRKEAPEYQDELPRNFLALSQPFQDSATVYRPGFFEAGSSGPISRKTKARKRPPKSLRKPKPKLANNADADQRNQEANNADADQRNQEELIATAKEKRKAVDEGASTAKSTKLNPLEVIPLGGFPNAQ